jgi:hypothetical protein
MTETSTHDNLPAPSPGRVTSIARVRTDRPGRYGKQLASHMGRKVPFAWDAETDSGTVTFAEGRVSATLRAEPDVLVMELVSTPEDVARYEDVLGRHLVRFGTRDNLVCAWMRSDGSDGTTQVTPEESK